MRDKYRAKDYISNLPQGIIENILCFLPIQEAARTSVLCRDLRYAWTKFPKLAFNKDTVKMPVDGYNDYGEKDSREPMKLQLSQWRHKLLNVINKVLIMRQGPVHEFTFSFHADETCVEIDQIVFQLSRNGNTVKKFTFELTEGCGYKLPLSLFSLHQLTELNLNRCSLDHQPTFKGFNSLTSLYLRDVDTSSKTLLHLLASCPVLKCLTLILQYANLQGERESHIAELFECLPKIENLSIGFWITEVWFKCFDQYRVPQKPPIELVCLKYLCLDLNFDNGLYCLSLLIKSSPNLVKLKLSIYDYKSDMDLEEFADMWLEHLNELEIKSLYNHKANLGFLKLILTKSPVLKKLRIINNICSRGSHDELLKISRILLSSPRASPEVEIIV